MAPQQWGFDVVDTTPPVLGDVRPDDGSAGADRTPAISFAVSDAGTGLDPAAISLTVDGRDVTARGVLAGGRFGYVPSDPLGFGSHSVSARATDRSGNVSAPLTWSFQVRDETPPVIAQRSPLPGSTVVGATPIGFAVSDQGTGVDDDTLRVTVDGSDVTSWGSFASGRFVYAPGNLGAGVHTVAVTVADTSGNVAGPVMWQFAVADPARVALSALSVPSRITAGGSARLRYRATANGSPLVGTSLRLESRPAGQDGFSDAGIRVTDAGGDVSWTVHPRITTEYRVVIVETGAETDARTVVVGQRVTPVGSPVAGAPRRHDPPVRQRAAGPRGRSRAGAAADQAGMGDGLQAAPQRPFAVHSDPAAACERPLRVPGGGGRHRRQRDRHQPQRDGAGGVAGEPGGRRGHARPVSPGRQLESLCDSRFSRRSTRNERRLMAAPAATLEALNPQQREAVLCTEGPLLVVAGAGSGKTRVLTHRIAHLIDQELASPTEVLAITFTNRAATEMKERVQQLVGGRIAARMWVMTFHSACGRMLRRDAELIGYRSNFTIYDQADQVRLVKSCIEDLGKDPKRFVPRAVHGAISHAKDRLLTAELYRAAGGRLLRGGGGLGLRPLRAAAVGGQRDGLRRPDHEDRAAAASGCPRRGATGSRPSAT